jgi:hypothetical protein
MKSPHTKAECELLIALAGMAIQHCLTSENEFDNGSVSADEICEAVLLEYGILERQVVNVKPAFFGLLPRKEERIVFSDARHGELMEVSANWVDL